MLENNMKDFVLQIWSGSCLVVLHKLFLSFTSVPESRFDHDSPGSEEDEEEEEDLRDSSPHSNAHTDGDYVPDSPVMSPVELKQEHPKYLPALQVLGQSSEWNL